eukprot:195560_1
MSGIQKAANKVLRRVPHQPLNFHDSATAFKSKSNLELCRALFVFQMCSYESIVKNSGRMISVSNKCFGESFTSSVIRHTFFNHFCAGESSSDIGPVIDKLRANGVGAVLDYAAEADLDEEHEDGEDVLDEENEDMAERQCDRNARKIRRCIDAAAASGSGFIALKLTALAQPKILEHTSDVIRTVRSLFKQFEEIKSTNIKFEQFSSALDKLRADLPDSDKMKIFKQFRPSENGTIDVSDWVDYPRVMILIFNRSPLVQAQIPALGHFHFHHLLTMS